MPAVYRVCQSSNMWWVACEYWQLCVSMILEEDRNTIQVSDSPFWDEGPDYSSYDDDEEMNGYPKQQDYNEAYKTLMDDFCRDHWDCMKVKKEKESDGKRKYVHNGIEARNNENTDVEVICGEGYDGLWYKGPKKVNVYLSSAKCKDANGVSEVRG